VLGSGRGLWYQAFPCFRAPSMAADSSLTAYVPQFIVKTKARSIPADVMHLGKRSILDGLGFALAGNAAEAGTP